MHLPSVIELRSTLIRDLMLADFAFALSFRLNPAGRPRAGRANEFDAIDSGGRGARSGSALWMAGAVVDNSA
ncbi:hypothetical protein Aglo01_54890 [Actinokineospora globicatena]|nr:hypothetical protein Aglo01_54890 [Actinokineospora globicatena]GLW88201.1 hypothetical protein Aglo02_58400 [Actinokineospora globicatena]